MDHQDWTPVIFYKKQQPRVSQRLSKQEQELRKDDHEGFDIPRFEQAYIKEVIQKRLAKKWSQKDLATALNEDIHRIQRFEQGKEVYDSKLKMKLNRVLS